MPAVGVGDVGAERGDLDLERLGPEHLDDAEAGADGDRSSNSFWTCSGVASVATSIIVRVPGRGACRGRSRRPRGPGVPGGPEPADDVGGELALGHGRDCARRRGDWQLADGVLLSNSSVAPNRYRHVHNRAHPPVAGSREAAAPWPTTHSRRLTRRTTTLRPSSPRRPNEAIRRRRGPPACRPTYPPGSAGTSCSSCSARAAWGPSTSPTTIELHRLVAVKIPHFGGPDQSNLRDRFLREARVAATLSHPNLCPVYDCGEIDGVLYLSMAYLEGRPLGKFIRPGQPLPARAVVAVVRQLALAMAEAHAKGVIHRDLKPANIMMTPAKQPVIMDFGLARRTDVEDLH